MGGQAELSSLPIRKIPQFAVIHLLTMPASKKTLRGQQQRANIAAGIGDASGKVPSRTKTENVMGTCKICKQQIRMVKQNVQAKAHVDSKHSGKKWADCFPDQPEGGPE